MTDSPLACTLGAIDGADRSRRWRQLAAEAAPVTRRTEGRLEIRYQPGPGGRARQHRADRGHVRGLSVPTPDDVAELVAELPEVTEGERHGTRTWFVAGQAFAWERPF